MQHPSPFDISDNVKATQCAAILKALRQAPLSTFEARDRLGIASPAARVFTLRKAGHDIKTTMRTVFDAQHRAHASAVYSLDEVKA